VLMNVPQAAAMVTMNETLKVLYKPKNGHNVFSYFLCAGMAGSFAAGMTIPLDNIKTRLQTQTFFNESRKSVPSSSAVEHFRSSFESKRQRFTLSLANMALRPFSSLHKNPCDVPISKNLTSSNQPDVKYRDIFSTARTIFREEGMRGFTKGLFPRVLASAPASAISWTTYEMMKKFLSSSPKLY